MKSYLFTTETDRGGVMLCDIDDFDEAVEYLCERFDGVVRVEAGDQTWQLPADQWSAPPQESAPVIDQPENAQPEAAENDLFG